MSEKRTTDPRHSPDAAAHEIVLELCKAGVFGVVHTDRGDELGKAVVLAHEQITAYYKSLK
ncbi:hypothetical protein GCM10010082_05800 [Kushneria pakistanensis]|uniref:Uncharacterized protein n=1 Tax=Kushneria pakistanensis TaxID=1508770 RepID=A0ABQ3FBX3_9GAMM|nr:hypothetical protein GCM10010082_05800 [Kushneria pakistanensis]